MLACTRVARCSGGVFPPVEILLRSGSMYVRRIQPGPLPRPAPPLLMFMRMGSPVHSERKVPLSTEFSHQECFLIDLDQFGSSRKKRLNIRNLLKVRRIVIILRPLPPEELTPQSAAFAAGAPAALPAQAPPRLSTHRKLAHRHARCAYKALWRIPKKRAKISSEYSSF